MAPAFHELQHEMFSLYAQQRYGDALELLRAGLEEHSGYRSRMSFWVACLESRLGRPEQALETLTELVSEGGWVSPSKLARDEDLAPLHGRPELAKLVEACEARRVSEQAAVLPELIVEAPAPATDQPPALVMALHMNGGDVLESRQHWLPVTRMGALLAMPQGTDLLGPGEFGWGPNTEAEVRQHVETLRAQHPFDPNRVVVGGASRGAAHSVEMALSGRPVPARGFIAIVGAPPAEVLEPQLERASEAGVRGLFISGDQDFALKRVEEAYRLLAHAGLEVRLEVLPGLGHLYPPSLPGLLRDALEFILNPGDRSSCVGGAGL